MTSLSYAFRPVTHDDLALLQRWLRAPDVVRWWGDPEHESDLLRGDLDEPRMVMRIVSWEAQPFAYAQDYDVDAWPQPHFNGLPAGTRAIDTFIGEPDMIGRGHGPRFLRLLAERLEREGAPLVVVDPDPANYRARRAYEKAGFRGNMRVDTSAGPAILMIFGGGAGPADLATARSSGRRPRRSRR